MIAELNRLVELVEDNLTEDLDVAGVATALGTTEYHLRRMFSSLAGMPLSEYIRRRRMTVAAADVLGSGDLLGIAVRYGYGSTEAFGRAFRSVHGVSPGDVRRDGGPLRTQPQLRFRLTVEGNTTMDTRITDRPAFRLVGHAARVPLIHEGVNPHIQAHIASLPLEEHARLKELGNTEPAGLLQVSADVDPDYTEGSELTYLHGVAVTDDTRCPMTSTRSRFRPARGRCSAPKATYPAALQSAWAATATEWFPSNPWRLRPGPSIVADPRPRRRLQHRHMRTVAPYRTRIVLARCWRTSAPMFPSGSDAYVLGSVIAWLVLPSSVTPIVSPFNLIRAARRCGQRSAAVSRPSPAVGWRFGWYETSCTSPAASASQALRATALGCVRTASATCGLLSFLGRNRPPSASWRGALTAGLVRTARAACLILVLRRARNDSLDPRLDVARVQRLVWAVPPDTLSVDYWYAAVLPAAIASSSVPAGGRDLHVEVPPPASFSPRLPRDSSSPRHFSPVSP